MNQFLNSVRLLQIQRMLTGMGLLGLLASCQHIATSSHTEGFKDSDQSSSYYSEKLESLSPAQRLSDQNQPKTRAWVLSFWNDTPVKFDGLGGFAANELRRGLLLTDRVIPPAEVREGLTTESFVDGEQVKMAQLIRESRRVGVNVALIGRIRKIVFRQKGDEIGLFRKRQSLVAVQVEVKAFDVQQGREVLASSKYGEANAENVVVVEDKRVEGPEFRVELIKLAMREALAGFIPEMVTAIDKMRWQGRIAKIEGSKYYLNAGLRTGLMNGDILTVMTSGEDVVDVETGVTLGRTSGRLKGTLEIVEQIGVDASVAHLHTGGNFSEGDKIQLY
jgi:hypothetical protein